MIDDYNNFRLIFLSARDILSAEDLTGLLRTGAFVSQGHSPTHPVFWTVLAGMGLAVLPPEPEDEDIPVEVYGDDEDSDALMHDEDDRPPAKRRRLTSSSRQIALPGEVITDDMQWMR